MPQGSLSAPASIDSISVSQQGAIGMGAVAQRLMQAGFDESALRTNGILQRDEWKAFDSRIVDTAREKLIVVGDLISRGLTYRLKNALGVMQLDWDVITDIDAAEVTMSGLPQAAKDTYDYSTVSMPIPIIHKEFQLNLRTVEAARRNGRALDTTHAEMATRKVAEKVESIVFNGVTVAANNGTIYGLKNHANRNTGSVTAAVATATGEQIVADVNRAMGISISDNMEGPWILYWPRVSWTRLGEDFKANSDKTIMSRLMELPGLLKIIPTSQLTVGFLLVQASSETVQIIDGMQPTMVEWESKGGFELNFKVMSIMLPRVRADAVGQSGIVHFT
jgi:uncharacterized linocin/CFP29 family protein